VPKSLIADAEKEPALNNLIIPHYHKPVNHEDDPFREMKFEVGFKKPY
jgi:hypothetical protein